MRPRVALVILLALATAGCAPSTPPTGGRPSIVATNSPFTTSGVTSPGPSDDASPNVSPPGDTNTQTQQEPTGAAATNKALATAEAERLLGLALLPPGAQPLSSQPASLQGPALGAPHTTSLVDKAKFWHVTSPFAKASAWVTAHPPAGLASDGTSSGDTAEGGQSAGVSYAAADSVHWTSARLEIDVASAGDGGSDIRADGIAAWWDPVPLRDTAQGQRLRVDVASGCPKSDRGFFGVRNERPGLTDALVPPGVPTQGLACVYAGINGTTFALLRSTPLTGSAAASLASVLAGNSLRHLDNVVTHCPMGDGSATVIALTYAGGPDVDIWYARNGCQYLANGAVTAAPDAKFLSQVSTFAP